MNREKVILSMDILYVRIKIYIIFLAHASIILCVLSLNLLISQVMLPCDLFFESISLRSQLVTIKDISILIHNTLQKSIHNIVC